MPVTCAVLPQQSESCEPRHRLAGTAFADDAQRLAACDRQANAAQDGHAAERDVEIRQFQERARAQRRRSGLRSYRTAPADGEQDATPASSKAAAMSSGGARLVARAVAPSSGRTT